MNQIFILEINFCAKYLQFKENFDYGCFPNDPGKTEYNYLKEIVCILLF